MVEIWFRQVSGGETGLSEALLRNGNVANALE